MERLTEKIESDTATRYYLTHCSGENACSDTSGLQICNDCLFNYEAEQKLGKYEDLEEEGKMLILPCAVGDTIYVIPSKTNYRLNIVNRHEKINRVYEQPVNRIEIYENGYLLSTCDGMQRVVDRFYGETWFLTREEAEAALKELEVVK